MLQVADISPINAFTFTEGDKPATTHAPATYVSELVDAQTWDNALGEFRDVSYEQSDSYMSGQWGDRVSRLLVRQPNGRVMGGALVVEIKAPLLSTGLAYVKFGPFWQRRDEDANEDVYLTVVTALRAEFCTKRGHMLSILPRPSPHAQQSEARVLRDFGFAQRRPFADPDRYLVQIHNDEDAQLKSLAQKWRYNLKKSVKNNITVTHSGDNEGLEVFKALHDEMVARKKFDDVDAVDLVPEMRAKLPEGLRPHIFIAHHNDEPVAGAVVGVMGDTAYYLYGASSKAALPRKAGYALQWEVLRWLQKSGADWYDLGGTVAEPGLHQFKKGLVGKSGRIWAMAGELDYWPNWRARVIGDALYFTRSLLQKLRAMF